MEIDKVKDRRDNSEEECWRAKLLDNKVHYKATIIHTMWYLQKDMPIKHNREFRNRPPEIYDKIPRKKTYE